jgi:spore maturation protein CgeB
VRLSARYWLDHEQERQQVADAGYRRVLSEHTYDHRFAAIFEELALPSGMPADA